MDERWHVEPLGRDVYLIASDHQRRLAFAVSRGAKTWVFIDGRTCIVEHGDRDAPSRPRATDDQFALSAPMPATVLSIEVAPGQAVQEGDLLMVLEAMKMEVPIRAPRAGTVKSIGVHQGDLVQPGVPLLDLD